MVRLGAVHKIKDAIEIYRINETIMILISSKRNFLHPKNQYLA